MDINMKPFVLKFSDNNDDEYRVQRVWSDITDDEYVSFRVQDLWECPEDAIIGRDLFDGYDFIETIELGMRLAQKGYDSIKIEEVPYESK